ERLQGRRRQLRRRRASASSSSAAAAASAAVQASVCGAERDRLQAGYRDLADQGAPLPRRQGHLRQVDEEEEGQGHLREPEAGQAPRYQRQGQPLAREGAEE